jgi:hypothetical protein
MPASTSTGRRGDREGTTGRHHRGCPGGVDALSEVRELLARGQLDDGASITALLYLLAFAPIDTAMKPGETVHETGAS